MSKAAIQKLKHTHLHAAWLLLPCMCQTNLFNHIWVHSFIPVCQLWFAMSSSWPRTSVFCVMFCYTGECVFCGFICRRWRLCFWFCVALWRRHTSFVKRLHAFQMRSWDADLLSSHISFPLQLYQVAVKEILVYHPVTCVLLENLEPWMLLSFVADAASRSWTELGKVTAVHGKDDHFLWPQQISV